MLSLQLSCCPANFPSCDSSELEEKALFAISKSLDLFDCRSLSFYWTNSLSLSSLSPAGHRRRSWSNGGPYLLNRSICFFKHIHTNRCCFSPQVPYSLAAWFKCRLLLGSQIFFGPSLLDIPSLFDRNWIVSRVFSLSAWKFPVSRCMTLGEERLLLLLLSLAVDATHCPPLPAEKRRARSKRVLPQSLGEKDCVLRGWIPVAGEEESGRRTGSSFEKRRCTSKSRHINSGSSEKCSLLGKSQFVSNPWWIRSFSHSDEIHEINYGSGHALGWSSHSPSPDIFSMDTCAKRSERQTHALLFFPSFCAVSDPLYPPIDSLGSASRPLIIPYNKQVARNGCCSKTRDRLHFNTILLLRQLNWIAIGSAGFAPLPPDESQTRERKFGTGCCGKREETRKR